MTNASQRIPANSSAKPPPRFRVVFAEEPRDEERMTDP